jgi:hypothetical protein
MPDVTFHNVTITINAADGASAYTALCDALGPLESEWVTDRYTIYDEEGHEVEAGSTDALWPQED